MLSPCTEGVVFDVHKRFGLHYAFEIVPFVAHKKLSKIQKFQLYRVGLEKIKAHVGCLYPSALSLSFRLGIRRSSLAE